MPDLHSLIFKSNSYTKQEDLSGLATFYTIQSNSQNVSEHCPLSNES